MDRITIDLMKWTLIPLLVALVLVAFVIITVGIGTTGLDKWIGDHMPQAIDVLKNIFGPITGRGVAAVRGTGWQGVSPSAATFATPVPSWPGVTGPSAAAPAWPTLAPSAVQPSIPGLPPSTTGPMVPGIGPSAVQPSGAGGVSDEARAEAAVRVAQGALSRCDASNALAWATSALQLDITNQDAIDVQEDAQRLAAALEALNATPDTTPEAVIDAANGVLAVCPGNATAIQRLTAAKTRLQAQTVWFAFATWATVIPGVLPDTAENVSRLCGWNLTLTGTTAKPMFRSGGDVFTFAVSSPYAEFQPAQVAVQVHRSFVEAHITKESLAPGRQVQLTGCTPFAWPTAAEAPSLGSATVRTPSEAERYGETSVPAATATPAGLKILEPEDKATPNKAAVKGNMAGGGGFCALLADPAKAGTSLGILIPAGATVEYGEAMPPNTTFDGRTYVWVVWPGIGSGWADYGCIK